MPRHTPLRHAVVCSLLVLAATGPALPRGPAPRAFLIRVDPDVGGARGEVVPSLAEALARAAAIRQRPGGPAASLVIELAGGVHRLSEAARIGQDLGGRPGTPLVIRGARDGTSRLSGSVPLRKADKAPPRGADPSVRDRIRAYSLPARAAAEPTVGVHRAHNVPSAPTGLELFDADGPLEPARWPNEGWAHLRLPADAPLPRDQDPYPALLAGPRADRWADEDDLWVDGYLGALWSHETLPAVAGAKGSQRVALAKAPLYAMREKDRFRVSHALAELDRPGEWWRDRAAGLVHLIPRGGPDAGVEASVADSLLVIDGARHVTVENLTLEQVRGDAVHVRGGGDVVVQDCTIRRTGGRGLFVEGATRSGLRRCVVADTGEVGVDVRAGDRDTLSSSGSFVEDSAVIRFARLGRTARGAVNVDGVGVRVVGNYFAQSPHIALWFQGNDHEIALNEITRVVRETSDSSAIYTGRDVTAQGSVLRANFLHDVQPSQPDFEVKGIYLDDMASGVRIENNFLLRVHQPIFVGGGRDNRVTGNVIALSSPAFHLDGRGVSWQGPSIEDPESTQNRILRSLPLQSAPWRARYPALARLMQDEPRKPKRNVFRDNLLIGSAPPNLDADVDPRAQTVADNPVAGADLAGAAASARRAADLAPALAAAPAAAARVPLERMDRRAALCARPAFARRLAAERPDAER